MSMFVGIMCIIASLYYGITAAWQETKTAMNMRLVACVLFFIATTLWLSL
jgi:hypothetical protein